jgi:hypothetical protein
VYYNARLMRERDGVTSVSCHVQLRGRSATSAFIDLGDQLLALQKGRTQAADDGRHFLTATQSAAVAPLIGSLATIQRKVDLVPVVRANEIWPIAQCGSYASLSRAAVGGSVALT